MVLAKKDEGEKLRLTIQRVVYILVTVLVFEGLLRKILPSALGLPIFFIKDILCAIGLVLINKAKAHFRGEMKRIMKVWKFMLIAFIPLFINTMFWDPVLLLFGMKQYLLYVVVCILVPLAFPPEKFDQFKRLIIFITFLVVPTTFVAILQNSLPPTHWLNLSVGGDSLEGFSSAGYLRVSSTFSFTGQYSWFINFLCAFLAVRICLPIIPENKFYKRINLYLLIAFCMLLLVAAFITGGRTAVLGCGACLFIGLILASIKASRKFMVKGVVLIATLILCLSVLRSIKPEFFAAYDQRSSGTEERTHSAEIEERVMGDVFGWTTWMFDQGSMQLLFGNGLGVMSNGSDKISGYASDIRSRLWTETDIATVAWEGGLYLIVLWYGFRIWVMISVFRIWRSIKVKSMGVALSFLLAYIMIIGSYGTISSQPPLAIWWWLSVGSFFTIGNYYLDIRKRYIVSKN